MRYQQSNERRAVILMVVLSLLTLFAIVGITFVLYADAEAASARVARQAETQQRADVPAQQALSFFLGQLIYDVFDTPATAGSALRGHSLARNMFGYDSNATFPNNTPYNGMGRLHTNGATWPYLNPYGIDDYLLVNYTYFSGDTFSRDPEYYTNTPQLAPGAARAGGYYVGCNPSYTYPDLNNLFLAAVRSDGVVLTPSFHRPWLFGGTLAPGTANWSTPQGKYLTLRPRPLEHPLFPYPDDPYGDVKNLVSGPGGNDSIWIDAGAPVMTAPDGTLYKMLFAPLIMDLDNRINVGSAGNIEGNNIASRSNSGWFPSEVNLSTLWSTSPTNSADWLKLFVGNGTSYGKYGPNQVPSGPLFPTGSPAHWYAQADLDGRNELANGALTAPIFLPGTNALAPATIPFPYFPQGYGSGSAAERLNHPAAYAVYPPYAAGNDDIWFRATTMEALLRPNSLGANAVDSGSSALVSYLTRLCPNSLGAAATIPQRRNWITTISNDFAKPGLSPWIYDPVNVASYAGAIAPSPLFPYAVNPATPLLPPSGGTLAFPTFAQRQTQANNASPAGSDFTTDWRAANAALLGRLDLNRSLPLFPHMASGSTTALVASNARYDNAAGSAMPVNIATAFQSAMQARQTFAIAIYTSLLAVTGVPPPSNLAVPTPADLAPRRWLAQLAVNIVDYIDDDEISTPFNFYNSANGPFGTPTTAANYQVAANTTAVTPTASTIPVWPAPPGGNPDVPTYWVFGTELPRLVINEVLGEYTLPTMNNNMSPPTVAAGNFNVNVWVELFNPLPLAATVTAAAQANTGSVTGLQPLDAQSVPLYQPLAGTAPAYNPYQLVLANVGEVVVPNPVPIPFSQGLWYNALGLNNNVLGTPQQLRYTVAPTALNPAGTPAICNFLTGAGLAGTVATPATLNVPIGGPAGGLAGQSYMIVGPSAADANNDITVAAGVPAITPIVSDPGMTYQVTFNPTPAAGQSQWSITVPSAAGVVPPSLSIYDNTIGISVLLRRLANPHLPPNPFLPTGLLTNPALPPNPYITVDYLSGPSLNGYGLDQKKNQLVEVNTFAVPIPLNNSAQPPVGPTSIGKLQPYASNNTRLVSQTTARAGTVALLNSHHTLGLQNLPLATPFTWLTHLDRLLISPMELLHVSGFAPHMLTQRFIISNTDPDVVLQPYNYPAPSPVPLPGNYVAGNYLTFQHYAPWFNPANRLYRLFEVVETHDGASGVPGANGRVPGKININTLWDPPTTYPLIYQALADPSVTPNNPNFNAATVNAMFQTLLTSRTPNLATPALSQADRPFLGMAAGYGPANDPQYPSAFGFPNGNGINHTLFSTGVPGTFPITPGQAALQLPNTAAANPQISHPYLQNEMLTKIYNRLTTRSNVFAVFVTVGFFQVMTNANGQAIAVGGLPYVPGVNGPPLLGPEIGRSEGRQIRHRMFAIVDRSQLAAFTGPLAVPYDPRNDPLVVPYFSIID